MSINRQFLAKRAAVFWGKDYKLLSDLLGGGDGVDEFLGVSVRHVLMRRKRESEPMIRSRLERLRGELQALIGTLTEEPDIYNYLISTDWLGDADYIHRDWPLAIQVLVDTLQFYENVTAEVLTNVCSRPQGGRPVERTRADLLRTIVSEYIDVFGQNPKCSYPGDFHDVAVKLLIKAGYFERSDDPNFDPDISKYLRKAVNEVLTST